MRTYVLLSTFNLSENQNQFRRAPRTARTLFSSTFPAASGDDITGQAIIWVIVLIVALVMFLIFAGIVWRFGSLWIQAMASGAGIGMTQLIGMNLRRVNAAMIVQARIMAKKAGLDISSRPP